MQSVCSLFDKKYLDPNQPINQSSVCIALSAIAIKVFIIYYNYYDELNF